MSSRWAKPAWQTVTGSSGTCSVTPGTGEATSCRQVPDVSASADPTHGDVIYCSAELCPSDGGWTPIGGTSTAAPLWAALAALADQGCGGAQLGFLNPRLYLLGHGSGDDFHDITTGTNDATGSHPGDYTAGPGYDNTTGWGTPDGASLFSDACQPAVDTPSAALSSAAAGATGVTYAVGFTTSSAGALSAGESVTVVGPPGTTFPAAGAQYGATASGDPLAVSAVAPLATGSSTADNAVVVTLGGAVPATTAVAITVHGVGNTTVAGPTSLSLATTADGTPGTVALTITPGPVSATSSTVSPATASTTAGGWPPTS